MLDKFRIMLYYTRAGSESCDMEKSRSWPSAHDWKSCIPQKGIEGSNPSFSAIKEYPVFVKNTGFFLLFERLFRYKSWNNSFG